MSAEPGVERRMVKIRMDASKLYSFFYVLLHPYLIMIDVTLTLLSNQTLYS